MLRATYSFLSRFMLAILFLAPGARIRPRQASAVGASYSVTSTADLPDTDVGDGVCLSSNGSCTLRAAVQQANFTAGADTINLPAGVFLLTRAGDDDAAVLGDLDITADLTIQGAGSAATIVDGNGAVTGDRVFQIISTAKETTLSRLTVRNGKRVNTFDEGGGIYWDGGGGHLHLTDVTVENNAGYYGGGLYLNYSNSADGVTLDHLTVQANTAAAAAGGLGVNFGDFAAFSLQNSLVASNSAYEGGGVYFQGVPSFGLLSVSITNTLITSNTASLSAGFENHSGSSAVPVVMQNSTLSQNQASAYGGAVGNYGTLNITTTTLDANTAVMRGGGIYDYEGGKLDIVQSTLSRNTSKTGGGVYSEFFTTNTAGLVLTNSTLSGNSASQDGGGIYADGGQVKLYNATIAANQVLVPLGTAYAGMGGGMYFMSRVGFSARNALIADNTHRYGAALPEPDDCFSSVSSVSYSLIENPANCAINGSMIGIITGRDPELSPLQNSSGPTQIQAPLRGSPAIDAGQTPNCIDANGAPILIDQRGVPRPQGGGCDMGAVENLPIELFLPIVRR